MEIELADYMVAQSDEIERLKELADIQAVALCETDEKLMTAETEIERLKGLLREAADRLESLPLLATDYFRIKDEVDGDIKRYREAGEKTK